MITTPVKRKCKSFELRNLFKRQLAQDDYKKLTHFAWVTKLEFNVPGTYSMYIMYEGGIAIATNSICINEWLEAHGQPRRRPTLQRTVDHKIRLNQDTTIDNRSDKWSQFKNTPPRVPGTPYAERQNLNPGEDIRELIWDMYAYQHMGKIDIAKALGFTPPNIYYHIKMKRKELDKQA